MKQRGSCRSLGKILDGVGAVQEKKKDLRYSKGSASPSATNDSWRPGKAARKFYTLIQDLGWLGKRKKDGMNWRQSNWVIAA